jgi:hypothetical protein
MRRATAWFAFAIVGLALLAEFMAAGRAHARGAAASEGGHEFVFRFSIFVLAIFVGYYRL